MKAETIMVIEAFLKGQRDDAHKDLNIIRDSLKNHYGKNWSPDNLSRADKQILKGQEDICNKMDDLYEDFMNHNWQ